jgi:hypothetical protein
MNRLINDTCKLLKNADFDWSICGGYAIDLFCGKKTRKHIDIDVCVFWENRNEVIQYMMDLNWTIYEAWRFRGGGMVHLITDLSQQKYVKNNIFCVKDSNKFFHVTPVGDNMFKCKIDLNEQVKLDYIEFLFNKRKNGYLLYSRNENIKRELDKAVLFYNVIPYLAPEIVLLYKSKEPKRDDYENDFTAAIPKMSDESKTWLKNALDLCYPDGHDWSNRLKN